jgi:hypothetical protein
LFVIAGSDTDEDDGIYSGFILATGLQNDGRHSVKIYVSNHDGSAEIWEQEDGMTGSNPDPYIAGMMHAIV